jgi:hypothetical protein
MVIVIIFVFRINVRFGVAAGGCKAFRKECTRCKNAGNHVPNRETLRVRECRHASPANLNRNVGPSLRRQCFVNV